MTLLELQEHIMHQTNNDADDLGDYLPHLNDYINEGYDKIVYVWDNNHVPSEDYPRLEEDDAVPNLPFWIHRQSPTATARFPPPPDSDCRRPGW